KPRRAAILALLAVTQLMGVLDFSIVNLALPSIERQFDLTPDRLQWVVSAYALTLGGFLLLGGRIADVFDRKLVFMLGLSVFAAASLAGGLAPTANLVFVARAVQGLGGAVLAPTALALVTSEFAEGAERNRALSVFGTVAALGFTAGVILGGALTGFAGWRWVFFVNVPIALAALIAAAGLLRLQGRQGARPRLDLAGVIFATAAMVALVAGLSQVTAPAGGWVRAGALLALAAGLLAGFVAVERSAADPLAPLGVFRHRVLTGANLVAGLTIVVASTLAFTLTLVVQRVMGYSPQLTGLAFLPAGLGGIVGGTAAGFAVRRAGFRWTSVAALAALATGTIVVLALGVGGSIVWLATGYGLAGVGIVGSVVATTIAATSALDRNRQGLAAGLLTTSQQVGGALGAAIAGVIDAPASLSSYEVSLLVAAGVVGAAMAVAVTSLRAAAGRPAAAGEADGKAA
ncbi:MAG TPA: MFS transporter, partial [Candidatus Dormibacteraeota bacterium]|nr:MFS transporter [Candidatus Dormibacteraeota bacterium]